MSNIALILLEEPVRRARHKNFPGSIGAVKRKPKSVTHGHLYPHVGRYAVSFNV
jgi:hypothetical protein